MITKLRLLVLRFLVALCVAVTSAAGRSAEAMSSCDVFEEAYVHKVSECAFKKWTAPKGTTDVQNVVADFDINFDGTVSAIKIEKSSGNKVVDQAATAAVKNAAPYPIPPHKLRQNGETSLTIQITFDLNSQYKWLLKYDGKDLSKSTTKMAGGSTLGSSPQDWNIDEKLRSSRRVIADHIMDIEQKLCSAEKISSPELSHNCSGLTDLGQMYGQIQDKVASRMFLLRAAELSESASNKPQFFKASAALAQNYYDYNEFAEAETWAKKSCTAAGDIAGLKDEKASTEHLLAKILYVTHREAQSRFELSR